MIKCNQIVLQRFRHKDLSILDDPLYTSSTTPPPREKKKRKTFSLLPDEGEVRMRKGK